MQNIKMIKQEDTICAIVTPLGTGGLSVIRLSGKEAISVASRLFHHTAGKSLIDAKTHTIHYGYVVDPLSGDKIDEVLAGIMRSPNSFTCEDVVEVSCHGGTLVTAKVLEAFLKGGARLSEPGEFTKRAFLNGRIDLAQAEAVIDVIQAKTEEGLRCAMWQMEGKLSTEINALNEEIVSAAAFLEAYIDFPEDDIDIDYKVVAGRVYSAIKRIDILIEGYYRWRPFREGILTAIVGRANVGKSSLLNILSGEERAIVTPYPGTTRDIVDVTVNVRGIPLRLLDTAGLRMTKDLAEEEGIKRMYKSIEAAELILLVLDWSEPLTREDEDIIAHTKNKKRVVVINKTDKENRIGRGLDIKDSPIIYTSIIKGEGIEGLKNTIQNIIVGQETIRGGETIVTNLRHKKALEGGREELNKFLESVDQQLPLEIQALFLRGAIDLLGEITGVVTTENILDRIFSEFCIGK